MKEQIEFRLAKLEDCDDIAMLHTTNWQTGYRGMVPDDYLDHRVESDRFKVWRERFGKEDPKMNIVVARDSDQNLAGFVCTFLDFHPKWGAYLDNLHVAPGYQGLGIGKTLMKKSAEWVKRERPDSTLYLHVLRENVGAIKFYEKLKGTFIGEVTLELPWGVEGTVFDYLWQLEDLTSL